MLSRDIRAHARFLATAQASVLLSQPYHYAQMQAAYVGQIALAHATAIYNFYYAPTSRRDSVPPRIPTSRAQSTSVSASYELALQEQSRRIALQLYLASRSRPSQSESNLLSAPSEATLFMDTPNMVIQEIRGDELYDDSDDDAFLSQLPTSCGHVQMEEDDPQTRLPTVDFLEFATPRLA
ncbi:hypothetical protein EXIGLDRAFT_840539 [Exidia glandulosa HHB12029]|uniref:Uncharacterized protein n=1 Tax=Exidia glandulosa HHB12029 TaxID=1314781 RepID=A0A165EDX7_EXIGL|nr:hypothetical protein EXIGLDRAFT_840539 [Exidia glandulosa HHB12029]